MVIFATIWAVFDYFAYNYYGKYNEMTWLWFTPFGWFNKILSPYHLAFESFIGIVIILIINGI